VLFAFSLNSQQQNQVWPPTTGRCPDYWTDSAGNGSKCQNVLGLGTCATAPDFTGGDFASSSTGNCARYNWATKCGVTWDGITYGYGTKMPCSTSSSSTSKK